MCIEDSIFNSKINIINEITCSEKPMEYLFQEVSDPWDITYYNLKTIT